MIRNRAVTDTKNPPGQTTSRPEPVRYLRDVIKKYYEDEKAFDEARKPKRTQELFMEEEATYPSTDAEKRLERLKTALLKLCDALDRDSRPAGGVWAGDIRKIIEENT